ncbi:ABC transporter ATP-binding protein [Chloroflexota bacterium]|nr:ABC transporter ATP-binding protein [Chloroflexota bacterium]
MSLLEVKDVSFSYQSRYQTNRVLNNVSCEFEAGKVYAVVGKSGSGKSTMLSLLGGLDLPDEGEVLFKQKPTSKMDLSRYRLESAAMIYQSFRLLPLLTVSENITLPMELRGFRGKPARDKAKELVSRVALPDSVLDRFPGMLSGGEQQRVAIARSLSMDTNLLLADEPTGNLDEENSQNIVDILVSIAHRDGYCVVIATHDLAILPKMDVVYHMKSGSLVEE